jgi:membrane-bound lytic murein transglycosylase F
MEIVKTVTKQITVIVLLLGGVLVLWEIPYHEKNLISHKDAVPYLGNKLPPYEIQTFLRHVETRLPSYREVFMQAEEETGVPWTLLASMAYQESKWNRHAVSPTGVRGLMMLTLSTASDLGIENRLDPSHSILGGARYLAQLRKRVPDNIRMPDRIFFALAAYNVGMGHVNDARLLAERLGKDPDKWDDLKQVLPLLAKKEFYKELPHRYARGWEPVQYVKRIRAYRNILEQLVDKTNKTPPLEI